MAATHRHRPLAQRLADADPVIQSGCLRAGAASPYAMLDADEAAHEVLEAARRHPAVHVPETAPGPHPGENPRRWAAALIRGAFRLRRFDRVDSPQAPDLFA
jgi:hypothetical protein